MTHNTKIKHDEKEEYTRITHIKIIIYCGKSLFRTFTQSIYCNGPFSKIELQRFRSIDTDKDNTRDKSNMWCIGHICFSKGNKTEEVFLHVIYRK